MVRDFEYSAWDFSAVLNIVVKIYDNTTGTPTLVSSLVLTHWFDGQYVANYTTDDAKKYLYRTIVYTDNTFTTPDTNYSPDSGKIDYLILDELFTDLTAVKAVVDAIQERTDRLPDDPADASDVAAAIDAIDLSPVQDVVDAIQAQTDQFTFTGGNVDAVANVVDDKTGYALASGQLVVKKNQALAAFPFPMVDIVNNDPAEGLTVTVMRRLDNGAFVACANAAYEVSDGLYAIDLDAADLNGDVVAFKFSAPGAVTHFASVLTSP